jgi:hypothetical protein
MPAHPLRQSPIRAAPQEQTLTVANERDTQFRGLWKMIALLTLPHPDRMSNPRSSPKILPD